MTTSRNVLINARRALLLILLATGSGFAFAEQNGPMEDELAAFNYVLGTQTIGSGYRFTSDPADVEAAKEVAKLGSNIIKINKKNGPEFETIVNLPFKYIFIWFHTRTWWYKGLDEAQKKDVYDETYQYAKSLLLNYNNTGKTFYLGHWEGDWMLLPDYDGKKNPPATAIQGMISWLNLKQAAIDDAKRDTPHENVEIFHYVEVNRVRDAMIDGKERLVNKVLPYINPDYVSYSAYDIQKLTVDEAGKTLDYVQSFLAEKPQIKGKRIFVGEFGISAQVVNYSQKDHEKINREMMIKFLKWGCPFVLYWEMYNNEVKDGVHKGFWLIDNKNIKWDLYFTFQDLYQQGRVWTTNFRETNQRLPNKDEYLEWAINHLENK